MTDGEFDVLGMAWVAGAAQALQSEAPGAMLFHPRLSVADVEGMDEAPGAIPFRPRLSVADVEGMDELQLVRAARWGWFDPNDPELDRAIERRCCQLAGQRYAAEQKAWQWEELARRATDITEKLNAEIPPPKRRQGRPKSQAWYETELKFWSDISDGQWKNPEALERESVDYLQQEFRPDIGPRSDRLVRQVRDDVLRVWRANPEISPTRHTLICLIALDNSSPGLRDFLGKRLRRRGFQC